MSFIKKHLASFLIGFLSLTIVCAGAAALNKAPLAPTVECDHYASTVTEHGTATCTDGGSSGTLICSKCKVTLQNDHTVGPLGHKYLAGKCVRCDMKESDDLEYELSTDGSYYTVTGPGGFTGENLHILAKHNDLPVIGVGEKAFYENTSLKYVTIDSGVQFIGKSAFAYCTALEHVSIDYGLISLGEFCFDYTDSLYTVDLPSSLEVIESYAFYDSNIKKIDIPEGITIIKTGTFENCYYLEEISFPSTIETIEENSFFNCDALAKINYYADYEWCDVWVWDDRILEVKPQNRFPGTGE